MPLNSGDAEAVMILGLVLFVLIRAVLRLGNICVCRFGGAISGLRFATLQIGPQRFCAPCSTFLSRFVLLCRHAAFHQFSEAQASQYRRAVKPALFEGNPIIGKTSYRWP